MSVGQALGLGGGEREVRDLILCLIQPGTSDNLDSHRTLG
jgi:hypothetical protein